VALRAARRLGEAAADPAARRALGFDAGALAERWRAWAEAPADPPPAVPFERA